MNFKNSYRTLITKIIVTIIITVTTSVYASERWDRPDKMYVRISGGASGLVTNGLNVPLHTLTINGKKIRHLPRTNKTKSLKYNVYAEAALGYYFMDNFRSDISYTHLFNPKFHLSSRVKINEIAPLNGKLNFNDFEAKQNINIKLHVDTFMANGFVDLYLTDLISFNAGLGLGVSNISGKLENIITPIGKITKAQLTQFFPEQDQYTTFKTKTNFALAGYLGVSVAATENTHVDLTYSYHFLGVVKILDGKKLDLSTHNVGVGIRFDF
jgi:opacity protein-like surface antigen